MYILLPVYNLSMSKLLILDTFYFMHRSFHGYPKDLKNSKDQYTGMTFGLAKAIFEIIKEINPTHMICAWESEELPSFRKTLYPDYQKTRMKMEPDDEMIFSGQFPYIIKLLDVFNIPRITSNGFEGDDVLGTMAVMAADKMDVVISSSDQDLMQLINDKITIFRPANAFAQRAYFNPVTFKAKYGFEPEKMIDYKALRGDPSDNIPGVKGIGEKTATKLLQEYGDLDSIYANIDKITGSVQKKLIEDKEKAYLSRQLATIITNIPIEFTFDRADLYDFDFNRVEKFFNEMEFKSLIKPLNEMREKNINSLPEF